MEVVVQRRTSCDPTFDPSARLLSRIARRSPQGLHFRTSQKIATWWERRSSLQERQKKVKKKPMWIYNKNCKIYQRLVHLDQPGLWWKFREKSLRHQEANRLAPLELLPVQSPCRYSCPLHTLRHQQCFRTLNVLLKRILVMPVQYLSTWFWVWLSIRSWRDFERRSSASCRRQVTVRASCTSNRKHLSSWRRSNVSPTSEEQQSGTIHCTCNEFQSQTNRRATTSNVEFVKLFSTEWDSHSFEAEPPFAWNDQQIN